MFPLPWWERVRACPVIDTGVRGALNDYAYLGGAFLWHVWAEAYIDNQWIALDPSMGMGPVDATYIGFCKISLSFMDLKQNFDLPLSRLMGNLDCSIQRYREEHRKTITVLKEARRMPLFRTFEINVVTGFWYAKRT